MVSKSMIIGAVAALIATGTGYYIATVSNNSTCSNGCPISAMLGSNPAKSEGDTPGSCCGKVSKASLFAKAPVSDTPTLAACVGGNAYALHAAPATCCEHE
jgi:hypothetical protein